MREGSGSSSNASGADGEYRPADPLAAAAAVARFATGERDEARKTSKAIEVD